MKALSRSPWLAVGAVGVVSVASHLAGRRIRAMIEAHLSGQGPICSRMVPR